MKVKLFVRERPEHRWTTAATRVPSFGLALSLALSLAGCGGGGSAPRASDEPVQVSSPTVAPPLVPHGHFLGGIDLAGEKRIAEALITRDGLVRLYIGDLFDFTQQAGGGHTDDLLNPEESMLFVGSHDDSGTGTGMVIGQVCTAPNTARFCDAPASSQIHLEWLSIDEIEGTLEATTSTGEQTWTLELDKWSFYYGSQAQLEGLQGTYRETLAPFARAGEVTVDIDAFGQISFQSAATGCAGDGRAEVHPDGSFDVYDVMLTISGCEESYAYLNSDYQGLAVWTQGGYWNYDAYLVTFLAAPEGPPPRPALTMRAAQVF